MRIVKITWACSSVAPCEDEVCFASEIVKDIEGDEVRVLVPCQHLCGQAETKPYFRRG